MSVLLALSLAGGAAAHRLDEYLQATLIGVNRDSTDVEIQLTPGVAILPIWMAVIDQDRDGRISPAEERAYLDRVIREVELRVDGAPAPLSLIESTFPTLEVLREGLGTVRLKLRAARGGHNLRFENRHLPQLSAYLVNCLAAPSDGLVVSRQVRDEPRGRSRSTILSTPAESRVHERRGSSRGRFGRPPSGCCCWPGSSRYGLPPSFWRFSSSLNCFSLRSM